MINGIHNRFPMTDMDELCCYLYDLKILDRTSALDLAAVELDKQILHINEDILDDWSEIKDNDRMYEQTLHHEMNACDYLGMDYVIYQYKIGYADTLNYILNLGNNDKLARIQDLYFDRNADVYELFDMTSDDEKEEFIKMMYSIEILQQDPDCFIDWYSEEYNVDMITHNQEKIKLHLNVKEDALLTLTKMFYRNLAREINSGKATLQEVYYLMRIYECDLQNHLSNNEVSYMIYFKDLYPKYLEIRDEFFKVLASENGISADTFNDNFTKYSINVKNGETKLSPNCTLKFLSTEQKLAVNNYCKRIYKKGYPNMTEAYEICKEWLKKAPYENVVFDN